MSSSVDNPIALMLSRFMGSKNQSSLLIQGPWGIGKSFCLEDFLSSYDFQSEGRFVARSSVSLFGKESLSDVQAAIFSSAKQVSTDEFAKERLGQSAKAYLKFYQFLDAPSNNRRRRWLTRKAGRVEVPWVGRMGELLAHGNYDLIDGFLVVLDDLERHSPNVSLKDVLGLAADLVAQRNSKVIAICNEDVLDDEERKLFNSFREKIFDVELRFQRSPRAVATIGAPEGAGYTRAAIDIFERLAVSNIRVVKRFSYLVDQFWGEIEREDERIVREVLEHAALLTWARYDPSAGVPADQFPSLSSEQHWFSAAMKDQEEPKQAWRVAWESAASTLQFSSEPYDVLIVDYLRTGVWVPGSLSEYIRAKKHHLNQLAAQDALRKMWRSYADSLDPDMTPIVDGFLDVMVRHTDFLAPADADAVFSLLEDLEVDVSEIRDDYLNSRRQAIAQAVNEEWPFLGFRSNAMKSAMDEVRSSEARLPSIDSALSKISVDRSWDEEDVVVLASCSEDDLKKWIESEPVDMARKIKGGLLTFRTMHSDDVRYKEIGEKAVRVLRYFAGLSELNRVRVKNMFNIDTLDE